MVQKSLLTLTLLLICGAGAVTLDPPATLPSIGQINCISQGQLGTLAAYVKKVVAEYFAFKDPACAGAFAILDKARLAAETFQPVNAAKLTLELDGAKAALQGLCDGATAIIDKLEAEALFTIAEVAAGAPCNPVDPGFNFTDVFDYSGLLQLNISCIPTPVTCTCVKATLGNPCPCDCGEL
nr:PREDICTED: uncharacterized protein LOC109030193 [Bemisia tabaci]